jgi:glycosyltransferase involved in cell wall biosynthesis
LKKLLYIGNKLSKHGMTPTSIEILGPLLVREGFVVSYASSQKNIYFRMVRMLGAVFQKRTSDFVIIDTYSTTNFWYAFVISQLCRILNVRYVPILRGGDLPNRFVKSSFFCHLIFKYAFQNVVPSQYLYSSFRNFGIYSLKFIPNSIELSNYSFLERKAVKPNLLWVRSFASIYNPIMAVEVFYKIKKLYPDATLCMVGPDKDGSLIETQQKAKELQLDIRFTGKLSKSDWIKLSQEYDIFINTTHFDNTPVSVIEAMALGLAVVSTNVGGIPFLLENEKEGVLVLDNDIDEMVKAIKKLIENPKIVMNLTQSARRKAESFDWEIVKHKWFEILNK